MKTLGILGARNVARSNHQDYIEATPAIILQPVFEKRWTRLRYDLPETCPLVELDEVTIGDAIAFAFAEPKSKGSKNSSTDTALLPMRGYAHSAENMHAVFVSDSDHSDQFTRIFRQPKDIVRS